MAKESESKKGRAEGSSWLLEALRLDGEKKSHCVKLDPAGSLRGFLLIVTDYS